jgi:hypothetical protein
LMRCVSRTGGGTEVTSVDDVRSRGLANRPVSGGFTNVVGLVAA